MKIYKERRFVELTNYAILNWLKDSDSDSKSIQIVLDGCISKDKDAGIKIIQELLMDRTLEVYKLVLSKNKKTNIKEMISDCDLIE